MRILYLSQYFPPEIGATQTRSFEMAHNLTLLGHQVTVITEIPNHPSGVIPKAYRGKLYERSNLNGIDVIRVWVKTSSQKSFLNRMIFYLSYMLFSVIAGIFIARGKYQLIYATSPPLFVGVAGITLAFLKHGSFFFEVRDLWPESAIELGELSNPKAIRLAYWLANVCYARARKIVVVSQGIFDGLVLRGIQQSKLVLIPNGANTELFHFRPNGREHVRSHLELQGKFIAIYAGIHGIAQGLEMAIEAANLLKDDPQIHIMMIGDGPRKKELVKLAEKYGLINVTFIGEIPREEIPDYFSAADIALVPLRKLGLFKGVLPSKIFDAWACSRAVLVSVDGEARTLVEKANGGIYITPEDPFALKDALVAMIETQDDVIQMGINGREFTEKFYSRKAQADKLAAEIQSLV